MVKEIPLGTSGLVALVDDCDYSLVNRYKWRVKPDLYTCYVIRTVHLNGKRTSVRLQRQILSPPPHLVVNFINGNGLDCRRENMRLCTQAENLRYRRLFRNSTSGYKGVYEQYPGKWTAYISDDGRNRFVGTYDTPEEAANAYNRHARWSYGEFAVLNEIKPKKTALIQSEQSQKGWNNIIKAHDQVITIK